jgi:hypothetical protein
MPSSLPAEHLTGWAEGMRQLQRLAGQLNALDEQNAATSRNCSSSGTARLSDCMMANTAVFSSLTVRCFPLAQPPGAAEY